jgi:hypothetical protein
MHPLDQLLTAARPVPDISPEGLHKARTSLNTALGTGLRASAAGAGRKTASPGRRAKALIGMAVAVAGAAVAVTVIAMPSSPAGSSAKPASAPVALTAATVLDQAARAAGAQPGWPNARYWYTEDKYTCGGRLYTDKIWLARHGSGVVEKSGPRDGGSCGADLFTAAIPAGLADTTFGPYTWSQLFALPTNPAKLKPKLLAGRQSNQGFFQYVMMNLLTGTPAPPALREALFKVAASIPGVRVTGRYTDPLGRTGTALELGAVTVVLDPASGLVLDETNRPSTVMFVAQGPAASEPRLARQAVVGQ